MKRIKPEPGQESVWDYPRPPRLERTSRRIRVVLGGVTVVDTDAGWRVLETSHPPVYYLPREAFTHCQISGSARTSFCEFKGHATYATLEARGRVEPDAAWSYPSPSPGFEPLQGHLAVYPARMDACLVDGERVNAQAGDFYGGWITSEIVGPFKGGSGTWG
ncbi:MAG: DUF427 domain-containing protein [Actinomycetota bacterium]|nr:DUF427 domain-containing protein [Euzebyaceae bacterium]MDQ3451388.1 DUF427 domain-containing protein [Actinomycetota bacterium]